MLRQFTFILSVSMRHLLSKKKQTILVITGVAVGAMVMILTFALTKGIITEIQSKIIEVSPLIVVKGEKIKEKERLLVNSAEPSEKLTIISRILPDDKKEIKPYTQIISLIDQFPEIDAASPFILTRGVLRYRSLYRPIIIKGILPGREAKIANLSKNVIKGSLNELAYTKDGIILGSVLAKNLKAGYRDIMLLTGEDGHVYNLRVTGIFQSGFKATDESFAFVNLPLAQSINGFSSNVVSAIGLHTPSLESVKEVAEKISAATGYKTETWDEANKNVITLFERNNNITLFFVVFVFVVAGFGIANVLITIVLQKQKDIAIMKSMGVSNNSVLLIFISEGLILGFAGALIGMAAGHLLTNFISALPVSYGESAVVRSDHIATVQTVSSYVIVGVFSVFISAVSSYIPARRASKLKPVEILRA
ncbi:MAG: ABC transporter permease [Syntrophothermus sp.]